MSVAATAAALRRVGMGGITGSPVAFAVVLVAMALLLAVPFAHNGYLESVFRNILMYAAMAYGWNLIGGYTGYVSFGNVTFFGIGAYCAAILSEHGINNLALAIVLGALASAAFAVIVTLAGAVW